MQKHLGIIFITRLTTGAHHIREFASIVQIHSVVLIHYTQYSAC